MALELIATGTLDKTGKIITINDVTGGDNLAGSKKYSTGITNLNRSKNNTVTEIVITMANGTVHTFYKNASFNSVDINISATDENNLMPKTVVSVDISNLELGINTVLPVGIIKVEYYVWYILSGLTSGQGKKLTTTTISVAGTTNLNLNSFLYDTDLIKVIYSSTTVPISQAKVVTNVVTNIDTYLNTKVINLNKPILNELIPENSSVIIMAGYKTTVYIKSDVELLECFQPKIAKTSIQKKSCCSTCKGSDIDALKDVLDGLFIVDAQLEAELYVQADSNLKTLLKICKSDGCNC
jgi:hypothetical protein